MRHQHRHGHVAQDLAGGAAEDELANARVAVATHHDEVGSQVGGAREQDVSDVEGTLALARQLSALSP